MEDFEVVQVDRELLVAAQKELDIVKREKYEEKERMNQEMRLLVEEIESILKEKSEQEQEFNNINQMMQSNLNDCQIIIERLAKDLKVSEKTVFRTKQEMKACQDRYRQIEERNASLIEQLHCCRTENQLMSRQLSELNALLEQKTRLGQELAKDLSDERSKNEMNAYFKEYVELIESELEEEKKQNKQQLEEQEKILSNQKMEQEENAEKLKKLHQAFIDQVMKENQDLRKEIDNLRFNMIVNSKLFVQPENINVRKQNSSSTQTEQPSLKLKKIQFKPILSLPYYPLKQITYQNDLVNTRLPQQNPKFGDEEKVEHKQEKEEDSKTSCHCSSSSFSSLSFSSPFILPELKKFLLINDNTSLVNYISCQNSHVEQIIVLKKKIENLEDHLNNIDIHTFLIQLEKKVDDLYFKDQVKSRNSILTKEVDQILRSIRQLCDYHNITMEYKL